MKLSIITINRNNASGLSKTIESVVSQSFADYEYIVIDGASNDDSVNVIRQYADNISHWVSEPDKGIFNAMNKGIIKATGEYCLFLNSGDWLTDSNVITDFVNSNLTEDIISGNLIQVYENNKTTTWIPESKELMNFDCLYDGSLPHQATFIKTELFTRYGLYNELNKIVSDREFFLKTLVYENCSYNHFDRVISNYDMNGISANPQWMEIHDAEVKQLFQRYLPPLLLESYIRLWDENRRSAPMATEYRNLKEGKLGFVVKLLLKIKNK